MVNSPSSEYSFVKHHVDSMQHSRWDSKWDTETREGAIAFLGEIYLNDAAWGHEAKVKQWTLNILVQLSSHNEMQFAETLLQGLQNDLVASVGDDTIVRLWDAETGACLRLLAGHSNRIRSMVFSPKGDRIISSSKDKTVRIWDVGVRTSQRTSSSHIGAVNLIKCSPKGDQVASCSSGDMTVRLWDVETGSCRHILRGHSKEISCIAYSPEGDQIATGSDDTTIRLWDIETGRCTYTLVDHSQVVYEILYSPQGDRIASCSGDDTVRLWHVESGECLSTLDSGVYIATLSPNWGRFATLSQDIVQLRDVETSDCTGELRGIEFDGGMIWSPQGDQIAITDSCKPMALWKIKNNKQDDDKYQAGNENDIDYGDDDEMDDDYEDDGENDDDHEDDGSNDGGSVPYTDFESEHVAFSPNDLIVTASFDQTVRLWDAVSGQCRAVIQDFQHGVKDIAWVQTPNAQYVVAGCEDGVVGMWQVIMDGDRCQVRLHWKTTNGMFNAEDAIIQDVQGLSPLNEQILMRRVVEEDVESDEENDENEEIVNQRASLSPTEDLPKQPFEPDEEHEGVAKRTCGNERVSSME
ncbi:MAG: WD40-repeat-containing domain protein [Benniella sp.]|nr:MAG: WD40-repeat-containing domain protein [Benniella sp.]